MPVTQDDAHTVTEQERVFLRRAIELAREARDSGNRPFGSLLVAHDGTVLAEATNTELSDNDLRAHPELKLAVWAAQHLSPETARTTTMYTSTENCAMCAGGFAMSGLGRLVFAVSGAQLREFRGTEGTAPAMPASAVLQHASYPITVIGPALADEGMTVHRP